MAVRVVLVGLGPIGAAVARQLAGRKGFQIVGAVDVDPLKIGKDAGDVLELGRRLRLKVHDSIGKTIKATRPDVAVLCTSSSLKAVVGQFEEVLKHRVPIVTTTEEAAYPSRANRRLAARLDAAARKAKVAVLGTGVNPGFTMDALALMLTAPCARVSRVAVTRVVDAGTRRLPLQRKVGAGLNLNQFRRAITEGTVRHVGLVESVHMIAAGLGWKVDRVEETLDPAIAPRDLDTDYLRIPAGAAAGIRQHARGWIKNEPVISLDLQMYVGAESPRDHVLVDGLPPIDMTINGGVAGDIATAAIVVNAIPKVVAAPPGLLTMKDMPLVHRFNPLEAKELAGAKGRKKK